MRSRNSKQMFFLAAFCVAVLFVLTACSSLEKKESASFQFRAYEEVGLENGLRILLVRDDRLPAFSASLYLKTGSSADPKGQEGVGAMTAALLERGTKQKSSLVLAEALNDLGTEFDASVVSDFSSFRVSSLAKDQLDLVKLLSEILLQPAFETAEVERARKEFLSSISRSVDNPSGFADRAFEQLLYVGSPYSKPESGYLRTVKKLNRADIQSFYRTHYLPNNALMVLVGQLDPALIKQVKQLFGGWARGPVPAVPHEPPLGIQGYDLTVADKPDLVQSQIRIGHFSVPRSHPDFLKIRLANSILGSGFTSRLMNRIRDELGLTYSISSQYSALRELGALEIKTFSRNEKVGETLREIMDVYKRFQEKGVSKDEVEDAKNFLIGQFPQAIETADAWAGNLAILRMYGVPDSYLKEFIPTVRAISHEEINQVIQKHFSPSTLRVFVYTSEAAVRDQLKGFSDVEVVKPGTFQ